MIYAIAFYWLCAGIASVRFERLDPNQEIASLLHLAASLALGGISIPVRILAKMAE